jgi:hypothetical protein
LKSTIVVGKADGLRVWHGGENMHVQDFDRKLRKKEREKKRKHVILNFSISLAAPSKAWVCDSPLSGVEGSSPAASMDVCLL